MNKAHSLQLDRSLNCPKLLSRVCFTLISCAMIYFINFNMFPAFIRLYQWQREQRIYQRGRGTSLPTSSYSKYLYPPWVSVPTLSKWPAVSPGFSTYFVKMTSSKSVFQYLLCQDGPVSTSLFVLNYFPVQTMPVLCCIHVPKFCHNDIKPKYFIVMLLWQSYFSFIVIERCINIHCINYFKPINSSDGYIYSICYVIQIGCIVFS